MINKWSNQIALDFFIFGANKLLRGYWLNHRHLRILLGLWVNFSLFWFYRNYGFSATHVLTWQYTRILPFQKKTNKKRIDIYKAWAFGVGVVWLIGCPSILDVFSFWECSFCFGFLVSWYLLVLLTLLKKMALNLATDESFKWRKVQGWTHHPPSFTPCTTGPWGFSVTFLFWVTV